MRAGDDRELGGGSGIPQANAAGETDGGSAGAGWLPAGAAEPAPEAGPKAGTAPEDAVPKDALLEDTGPAGSWPADFAADSAG